MTLCLVAATAVGVGAVVYWSYHALIQRQQRDDLVLHAGNETRLFRSSIHELVNDATLLSGLPSIRQLIAVRRTPPHDPDDEKPWKDSLAGVFHEMLRAKPYYDQVRLIGVEDDGREIVRVQRIPGQTAIVRVPDDQLQAKGEHDYFKLGLIQPPGVVYLSDVSLNRENGQIETPHRPMLRAVVPVRADDESLAGVIVINLLFQPFINEVFRSGDGDYSHYLTNDRGDFLVHPDPAMTFGFDRDQPHRVQDVFPSVAPLFAPDADAAGTGNVYFLKAHIFPDDPSRFVAVGMTADNTEAGAAALDIAWRGAGVAAVLLLVASAWGYRWSTRLTRPLAEITAAAERIAHDEQHVALPEHRSDEIGVVARAIAHMVDTLKDNEADLADVNDRLRRTIEDMEHFAHLASHDLREPARRIAGFASLLTTKHTDDLSPKTLDLLERLQVSSTRMLDQITDLRAFTEVGNGELVRAKVPMADVVHDALMPYQDELTARGIKVVIDELPVLSVYRNLAQTLYQQLIDNALRHAAGNGFALRFTARRAGGRWIMGVHNTGSHIDPAQQRRVFAPFVRLHRGPDQLGIGLSICRRIVERHAGEIHVDSGPNHVHVQFNFGKEPVHDHART